MSTETKKFPIRPWMVVAFIAVVLALMFNGSDKNALTCETVKNASTSAEKIVQLLNDLKQENIEGIQAGIATLPEDEQKAAVAKITTLFSTLETEKNNLVRYANSCDINNDDYVTSVQHAGANFVETTDMLQNGLLNLIAKGTGVTP